MVINVGVNGFGRVGRVVSRACLQNSGLQLTAINDPAISVDYVSYLMKFDSTHGKLNADVTNNDNEIIVDGHHVKVFHEKYPPNVPWQAAGVQYVVEASGMFTSYEKASGHLLSIGVKRVIVTAPSVDVPMIILGVNDTNITSGICIYGKDCRVISCASSTLYCLAPIIKVLDDNFGVEDGFVTSIHAMTPSLKPLDGLCLRGRHWRDHRSIHQNIIPAPTGACKALGKILPKVKDKLSGLAFRVPIVNVSVLDLTVRLQNNTTLADVVQAAQKASKSCLRKIIKVSREAAVSSDFIADSHSCILDVDSSLQLKPNFYKIICWYENEHSYACRVVDSIIFSENQFFIKIPVALGLRPVMSTKLLQTEIPIICNCNSGAGFGATSNVSQDTDVEARTSTLSIPDRKINYLSIPSLNSLKLNKTDELIKIWKNRSDKQSTKPSKCSFFQSCTGSQPLSLKHIECNTQQRLENVKREFTKMVNMTEDLLKKTQSNQGVRSTYKVEIKSEAGGSPKEKTDSTRTDAKSYTKIANNAKKSSDKNDNMCSGDMIQTQTEKWKNDGGGLTVYKSILDENTDKTKKKDPKNSIARALKELYEGDKDKEDILKLKGKTNIENNLKLDANKSKQFIETTASLDDRLSQHKQFECVWNCHHLNTNKDAENEETTTKVAHVHAVTDLTVFNDKHLSFHEKEVKYDETNSLKRVKIAMAGKEFDLKEKHSKIELIDEELRRRNIVLVQNGLVVDNESECAEDKDGSMAETDDTSKLEEDIVRLSDPDLGNYTVTLIPEDISKYVTPANTITTLSKVCENRQDIYDKLDSTSGSHSSNSLEIKTKRSQIIQLADLSNSLEDLTRLNNICKIIEISDELSDKLFSALDDAQPDTKMKKWSFKDLCARLNLDEFCNKVFGGTAV